MDRSRSKHQQSIWDVVKRKLVEHDDAISRINNRNLALPDWQAPTLGNSWVNYGPGEENAGYWKSSAGIVYLRGVIKNGTVGAVAFTLPVGCRPSGNRRYAVISAGAVSGYIMVASNGQVSIAAGSNTWIDLAPVSFRAEG